MSATSPPAARGSHGSDGPAPDSGVEVGVRAPTMTPRQLGALIVLLGAQFMLAVDFSILNVALPDVGRGLDFSLHNLQWVATAFALPAAGFTLLFGRVADVVGRRRLFMTGLVLLGVSSLLGGLAGSPGTLLTARVVQGLATAMAMPAAMSLLTTTFGEGPLRTRALGLSGALLSAGFTAGSVLGGVLTDLLSWRWTFLVNVPVVVALVIAAPLLLTESRASDRVRLDVPGAVTVSGGLLALVYGATRAGEQGWTDPVTVVVLVLAVVLLVAFARIEARAPQPLAPIRILTRRSVSWGNLGGLVTFSMMTAVVFLTTLYLQNVLGYSPLATGMTFAGTGVVAFLGGVFAPRIIARVGRRVALASGLAVQALFTAPLMFLSDRDGDILLLLVVCSVAAFGHLVAIVAFTVTATSGLPNEDQGLATGLASMTQQVGMTIGIPIMSAIATARTETLAADHSAQDAFLGGLRYALAANTAIVVVGAVLVWFFLKPRAGVAREKA